MLSRDARHLALNQVGLSGQKKISSGTVLLIGAGGIGCAVATYLTSSGIGHIKISDFDTVDATNLGRQIIYTPGDLGQKKAEVAASRLRVFNPNIQITSINERLQNEALMFQIESSDVVIDGSDNFTTRLQINQACVLAKKRLISGSAIRLEGQLAVFGPSYKYSPCYQCLYDKDDESIGNCVGNGVLSPVPGVIGTLMAIEALKYFVGIQTDTSKLLLYDAALSEFKSLKINKQHICPICN
ncbi:MAG: molybdopterin-synthase adenylyltransferase MoeB [Gammaproteobacteria bacterium]|nr:molybdopterin-synthase adenylyltransferase MoeB [Gammaproteobacteria bacterium]|tara:strand:+ start:545 stop:1270 length:726 start_codon:yes stop_codon:yes gene_type:complete